MKLAFSTKDVARKSFLDICKMASDYEFSGFEIYDALEEMRKHHDSILRSDKSADAKRKLYNRSLEISALKYPHYLDSTLANAKDIKAYVSLAAYSGSDKVIVELNNKLSFDELKALLSPAIELAQTMGVSILFETANSLSYTENVIEIINSFKSIVLGACWNVRETYFNSNETPKDTIKILGAHINYVRLGDKKGKQNTLIGEGDLPVNDVLNALSSLNYDGFVLADWNDEIADADIVLTHFKSYLSGVDSLSKSKASLQYNRSHTGTYPWKKYEVIDQTFPQLLDFMAETYPDQYCFKYPTLDYTRTYAQFRRDVDTMAAALIDMGVKPGYHVAIWATNIPQWFVTFWAATRIGAVLVTVNTAYKINEAEYLLRQSDTHTLVMIKGGKESDYSKIMQELCPELKTLQNGKPLYSEKLPFLRHIVTCDFEMDGCLSWNDMLKRSQNIPLEEVRRRASLVKEDDVCNMQYTSGTTGFPKGVMLTHKNIINDGKIIGDRMDLSTADRMMIQVPMFHCFGMVLSMTSSFTHGVTMSPLPYFSAKSSLACVHQEKITCFNGVPTMFIGMFSHEDFDKTDFSYMRTGIMAGANCPPELMKRAAAEMNMTEILSVFGQTEAAPGCTMGEVNETIELRTETVGSAFPGVECKIINPETGEDVPDGENGEFVARGFNIMKGYYKMPDETAATIDKDGWLHFGDICCRTPAGYFKVTGRLKDMIIRGGENIYPREIEEFYLTNKKIRDVQVVGVPDKKFGEEACAWIILNNGETSDENEMRTYGLERIAGHKVPKYFIFVDEFPMNAAGKILKYKMKEISIEKLGL